MIILINGSERNEFSYIVNEMHKIRAQVFHDRLMWDVSVENGLERDEFDEENPLYLVSVDETKGIVQGSLRLLPTTGPNMLRDIFPILLDDGNVVESANIWEVSRFAIAPHAELPAPGRQLSYVTGELLAGIVEVGLTSGLSDVVAVFDSRMIRILRSGGYPPEIIGGPKKIGVCTTYAGLFEISEEKLKDIREACGIKHSVLDPQSTKRLFAA